MPTTRQKPKPTKPNQKPSQAQSQKPRQRVKQVLPGEIMRRNTKRTTKPKVPLQKRDPNLPKQTTNPPQRTQNQSQIVTKYKEHIVKRDKRINMLTRDNKQLNDVIERMKTEMERIGINPSMSMLFVLILVTFEPLMNEETHAKVQEDKVKFDMQLEKLECSIANLCESVDNETLLLDSFVKMVDDDMQKYDLHVDMRQLNV